MKHDHQVDIVVETPKGASNVYEWDARSQSIRLRAVGHADSAQPFERGHIANSFTPYGEPLPALLALSLPTFAGCRVPARVLGALEHDNGETVETVLVAVATVDARLGGVKHYNALERDAASFIENALREDARWLDLDAAFEIARAARQRWVLAQGKQDAVGTAPAWQMHEEDAIVLRHEIELMRFSRAEARLYILPLRFQNYVASLLAPHERILFWVHRPLITRARLGVFGREILRQGLLVLTDQQFLWLRDPVTPSHVVEGYGYIARTFALERTVHVAMQTRTNAVELCVTLLNARGDEEYVAIEFPSNARAEIEQAVRMLLRFAPHADETHLARRRLPEPFTRPLTDPTTSDATKTRATLERLQGALQIDLREETIYAQAFVPEWGGAKLLTVTDRFLRLTPDPLKRAVAHAIPLAQIGSVEICCSQLGSWFRVWLPARAKDVPGRGAGLEKWEVAFPVVFEREFGECATALRVMLAMPSSKARALRA